jgi:glycosyltransferase involved in cell wall biosynthesis
MPGLVSRLETEKLFSTAWVQVVPSLWPEPFGTVVIEAMMRGT